MSQSITFAVPYPGAPAGINHGQRVVPKRAKDGHVYHAPALTKEAKAFKELVFQTAMAEFMEQGLRPETGDKIRVDIQQQFPAERTSIDVDAPRKYVQDALVDLFNFWLEPGPGVKLWDDHDWGGENMATIVEEDLEPSIVVRVTWEERGNK